MRKIRLKLDKKYCKKCNAVDSLTNQTPATWRANATDIEVGAFENDLPIDLTGYTNLELVIRPDRVTSTNLAYQLSATPDSTTILAADWTAGTAQHVTFSLTDAELNFDLNSKERETYWLAVTARDTSGNETTLGTSWLIIEEDNNATADPPPEYPGAGIGENIIDAKGDLIVGLADNTPDRLAVGTNGQILIADSAETSGVKWGSASGTGDMLAATYDPNTVAGDAFDMDNMVEGATNKILTAAERTKLGDQVLTDVIDKMAYNADDLTFDIDTGTGVVVQIGQELLVKARNVTGSTITNGSVVRINGASGDRPTITPAQADSLANISGIIGIVTADILNNAVGFVTVHGLVRGLDTSTYTEGDELFLSDSVAGGFTSTEPTLSIPVGTVTFANPASGTIFANVDNQKHLLEFASDPTLVGNFSAADWKTALAIAAADVDFGTGTDSYVWTSDGAGGAAWEALSGGGDMVAATYDPTAVAGDAFAMDNMVEGATTKILTATERSEIAANTAASHAAVTVSDSAEIDLTLAGQDITASLIASSIDETKLDASVNASLDLADSASQPGHTHVISDITDNVAASTGVLTGGILTIGAPNTTFSISDGTGTIVDTTGAITNISWSGQTNLAVTNLLTDLLTWVSINSSGTVVQRNVAFTADVRRSEVCLGVLVHVNKTNLDAINTEATVAFNPHSTAQDLAASLGFINVEGNVFSANGANLNLNKSAGEIFYTGSNYDTSSTNPHVKTLPVLSALTFQYRFSDGSNGVTGIAIDPDFLDDGVGGLTAVGANRFSIQRITSFISNNVKIQRGVADYATLDDAVSGISSEAFVTEPSLKNGLLRGWLIVKKGATDLSDTADAKFISAGKLGEVGGGGGGGGGASEFLDSAFRIQDDGDITKEAAFELSGLTTATTRTITLPDKDGTLAMTSDITGGGGGLTQVAGTDADTTMGVGNMYVVDMTSWGTASRTYRLPTTAAVGEQIGITIKVGNANHELAIRSTIGSGDTINGVDHDADDWSRLFQAGETVIMECVTANSDWIVINDGRKPCSAKIQRTTAQTLVGGTYDQVEYDTEAYNFGMTTDIITNYNITVRRAGLYLIDSYTTFSDADLLFGSSYYSIGRLYVDGATTNNFQQGSIGAATTDRMSLMYDVTVELTAGQTVQQNINVAGATNADLFVSTAAPNWFDVKEILK